MRKTNLVKNKRENLIRIKEEKGITLVVLVITIIILAILGSIAIKEITGDEGLIGASKEATEESKITEYKEAIQEAVRSASIASITKGEEVSLQGIARAINNETEWVKNVTVNTNTDTSNEDIIITVTDGYVFQVYYDTTYGSIFVEHIGKDNQETPNVVATYNGDAINISTSGSNKVEIIYRVETVKEETNANITYSVGTNTGWYRVKVTSNTGNERNAWIRVNKYSERIYPPRIEITSDGTKNENNWYGADKKEVKVAITGETGEGEKIKYRAVGAKTVEEAEYTGEITINDIGLTTIYAWIENSAGEISKESITTVKYDNIAPNNIQIEMTGEQGENDWYKSDVKIKVTSVDETGSGVIGYYYKVDGKEEYTQNINKEITKETEGKSTVIITVVDLAGNRSEEKSIEVKKDTIAPSFAYDGITKKASGTTSFNIYALATDESSGNINDSGHIKYTCTVEGQQNVTEQATQDNGQWQVNGVSQNTRYSITVTATDEAGNETKVNTYFVTDAESMAGGSSGSTGPSVWGSLGNVSSYNDMIGLVVDYTPNIVTDYEIPSELIDDAQYVKPKTTPNKTWRIYEITDTYISLIAYTVSTGVNLPVLTLYNNSSRILDSLCDGLYATASYEGIVGRQAKLSDISKYLLWYYGPVKKIDDLSYTKGKMNGKIPGLLASYIDQNGEFNLESNKYTPFNSQNDYINYENIPINWTYGLVDTSLSYFWPVWNTTNRSCMMAWTTPRAMYMLANLDFDRGFVNSGTAFYTPDHYISTTNNSLNSLYYLLCISFYHNASNISDTKFEMCTYAWSRFNGNDLKLANRANNTNAYRTDTIYLNPIITIPRTSCNLELQGHTIHISPVD